MTENTLHPKYRPDIDGLRAIAVLSVVLYHAFPKLLSGGFAGVDVFFVISGFLISTILFQNIDRGTFSITDFYVRRIRRIFPALALVLLSVLIFGWYCLLPDELEQLGKHAASSAGFVQNFILWKEDGYFDNISETKPLLHIWSLGIEEQFYFVWPLLLWGAGKLGDLTSERRHKKLFYFIAIVSVFVISFLLNLDSIKTDLTKTFYLPQYRFFEMALGGILAWVVLYNSQKNIVSKWLNTKSAKNVLSLMGLLTLFVVFRKFDKYTVFPGENALLPVFATAFIIFSGPQAWLNRKILSNKVLVWFGLISFPLYLWHWPILSFGEIIYGQKPTPEFRALAIVVSILLSWFTVKVIEKPFRFGHARIGLKIASLCLAVFAVGALGYYLTGSHKEAEQLVKAAKENCKEKFPGWEDKKGGGTDIWCSLQNEAPTIALVGDSHSSHLFYGFVSTLKHTQESIANFPASCSAPFINVTTAIDASVPYRANNGRMMTLAYDYIGKTPSIKTVYLSHNPDCSLGNAIDLENPDEKNDEIVLRNGLVRTLAFLDSKNINAVIVLDNPTFPYRPGICQSRSSLLDSFKASCDVEIKSPARDRYKKMVAEVVASKFPNVKVLDLMPLFCHSGVCNPVQDGKILYLSSDMGGHLNKDGSLYVSDYLLKTVQVK